MSFRFTPFVLAAAAVMLAAVPAFSQAAFVQGSVTDPDGKIVVGAQIAFENADTKNHIDAKSDKKGHYITSMKPGVYSVNVMVDGKPVLSCVTPVMLFEGRRITTLEGLGTEDNPAPIQQATSVPIRARPI